MFAIAGWGLFTILAVIYLLFSRHMARRSEALSEYLEFLFQNRIVYEDHRGKYVKMLRDTLAGSPQITLRDLAIHSKHEMDEMAGRLHGQATVTNALGRGFVDKWENRDSAAEVVRADLERKAQRV